MPRPPSAPAALGTASPVRSAGRAGANLYMTKTDDAVPTGCEADGAAMAENNGRTGHRASARAWSLGRLARGHPVISAAGAVVGVGLIIFVLVWFQPQKLFLNKTVSESLPGVIATAPAGRTNHDATAGGSPSPDLRVLASGSFRSLEHATTGKAMVLRRPDGSLTCGYTCHVSPPAASCTRTGPDSSTWARSKATGEARTMPSRRARTRRHSRARSSGAAGLWSDSAWPHCRPEPS